jgi:hypothetical protein
LIASLSSEDAADDLENEVFEFQFHGMLCRTLEVLEKAEREWQVNAVGDAESLVHLQSSRTEAHGADSGCGRQFLINDAYASVLELLTKSGWTTFRPTAEGASCPTFFDTRRTS